MDVKTAHEIADRFNASGVSAKALSAQTHPQERVKTLKDFKEGKYKQIVCVDILGEGTDIPAVEVISMGCPTKSFVRFAQQFGRALRPMPGKDYAIVIDHVHNIQNPDGSINHGLPDDTGRIWSLDRVVKRKKATDDIQVKICIHCTFVYDVGLEACPYCGFVSETLLRSSPSQVCGSLVALTQEDLERLEIRSLISINQRLSIKLNL